MEAEKICKFAKKLETRRGNAYLCFKNMAKKEMLVFVNFPDKISSVPECVATHTFSTGHATPDCYTDESQMHECPNRIPYKPKRNRKK